MHDVTILRPTKTATQSGRRLHVPWRIAFHAPRELNIDPQMRWTQQVDTDQEVIISFDSKEAAIAYAKKRGLRYIVQETPPTAPIKPHSYTEHLQKPHLRS